MFIFQYICENHFQRLSKTSMFTGLKAVNHFGRPDMSSFLKFVQKKHSYVSKIGVFSCGPRPLTKVEEEDSLLIKWRLLIQMGFSFRVSCQRARR